MKRSIILVVILSFVFSLAGCSTEQKVVENEDKILVAAAASLNKCVGDELIPLFNEKYPNVTVYATYDSSGKLQTQIEEGAEVDVFMSAAMKQMNALNDKGLMDKDSVVQLLENKIVLIVPRNSDKEINSFDDILKSDMIAVGDPESVPAGQYAKEALENLGMWDEVSSKSSFGTNVTEVLNWIAEGSAEAGIVYATDAASNDNVKVVAEAPEGSVSKVIYPAGIVQASANQESAKLFIEFLKSREAMEVFEKYGFIGAE